VFRLNILRDFREGLPTRREFKAKPGKNGKVVVETLLSEP
jgi:hypothetical protein